MKLHALGFGTSGSAAIEPLQRLPAFRKATRAMMLAYAAVDLALKDAGLTELVQKKPELFSLLSASSFGELETTKDFLKHLADTGVARPLLFQNSLHNSTTGFLCIQYRLSAPALTLSHGCFAGEQALEAASTILDQGFCEYAIVCTVDTFITELLGSGGDRASLRENAAAVILRAEASGTPAKLILSDLRTTRERTNVKPSYAQLAAPNVEVLAQLAKLAASPSPSAGELLIEKTDVGRTLLTWSRP